MRRNAKAERKMGIRGLLDSCSILRGMILRAGAEGKIGREGIPFEKREYQD